METFRFVVVLFAVLVGLPAPRAAGQMPVDVHRNKYTPAQDVQLGQQAAAEASQQLPLLRDSQVAEIVDAIGRRLVAGLAPERRVPEFRYTFTVTNLKEINAFALPGGPMFINRGMLEAAKTEAEAAGVMAHELSHVVLRHGTAQATAATKFQVGQVAGQILGAVIGGAAGSVIAQGSDFGLGTYFLKYSREFERESDLLGAQILARAGYDPRDMAQMFKTLQAQGGARAPEWMSTHPDPGNRYDSIMREAASLRIENADNNGRGFAALQARLRALPPAQTAQQTGAANTTRRPTGGTGGGRNPRVTNVEPPSAQYRVVQADMTRVSVPANWQQDTTDGHLTLTPAGAVYQGNGASAFTHGVQIGTIQTQARDLNAATDELLQLYSRSNPQARRQGTRRETLSGQPALTTRLSNVSGVTGSRETVTVSTTQLRDGNLLYLLMTAPDTEARTYDPVFNRIRSSLEVGR
jgi:Zn-dependent protease with chaperone function